MWGKLWRATIVGAVIAGAGAAPAFAADGSYVPSTPEGSGLDGSVVQSQCTDEAPAIGYSIVRVGGSATARTASSPRAELVITGDGHRIAVPLTVDAAGEGHGSVLWPGVEVAADGTVEALPGWVRSGDQWKPRDDAAAWTTGDVTATLHVGDDSLAVPLAYPGYSDDCATPTGVASNGTPGTLAFTGGQLPIAAAVAGTAAVAAGAFLIVRRRRRVEQ